jgi:hypothetical protein
MLGLLTYIQVMKNVVKYGIKNEAVNAATTNLISFTVKSAFIEKKLTMNVDTNPICKHLFALRSKYSSTKPAINIETIPSTITPTEPISIRVVVSININMYF